jgi:hypothetical protein
MLHGIVKREYACVSAQGLTDTKLGRFIQAPCDEAMKNGRVVIGINKDWMRIFA